MLFVDNNNIYDPCLNLALEEYLLRSARTEEDILLFYINRPSIIIGRHQNTIEEINETFVREQQIDVVRRLSGGGAVYHDLGNLNFSFITAYHPDQFHGFARFTAPVVEALVSLGVRAELGGRNDILVDGLKVSGNAQYISGKRMFSHGTLLFRANLDRVGEALRVKPNKIVSKGIKSVRSRVTNIGDYLPQEMTIEAFRAFILTHIFSNGATVPQYWLAEDEWDAVRRLADERYRTWDWNYGQSPVYNIRREKRFSAGGIDVCFDVDQGIIHSCKIYGDFFSKGDVADLEEKLVGVRYQAEDICQALATLDLEQYFVGFPKEELLAFLCDL